MVCGGMSRCLLEEGVLVCVCDTSMSGARLEGRSLNLPYSDWLLSAMRCSIACRMMAVRSERSIVYIRADKDAKMWLDVYWHREDYAA